MPVTARLSERFYDVLGEDIATSWWTGSTLWISPTWVTTFIGLAGLMLALR